MSDSPFPLHDLVDWASRQGDGLQPAEMFNLRASVESGTYTLTPLEARLLASWGLMIKTAGDPMVEETIRRMLKDLIGARCPRCGYLHDPDALEPHRH